VFIELEGVLATPNSGDPGPMIATITILLLTANCVGHIVEIEAFGSEVGMVTDNRVIAVVPSFQEFQRICETLATDDVVAQHASCLLGAVLAHAHMQMAALAEAARKSEGHLCLDGVGDTSQEFLSQGPVILYDIDSFSDDLEGWRGALRQCLSLHPDARVIFTSRLADEDMWIEVLEKGGHDLLGKPFSETELRQAVRRALRRDSKTLATAA
jgi:CheY-like chemotaxis protein